MFRQDVFSYIKSKLSSGTLIVEGNIIDYFTFYELNQSVYYKRNAILGAILVIFLNFLKEFKHLICELTGLID